MWNQLILKPGCYLINLTENRFYNRWSSLFPAKTKNQSKVFSDSRITFWSLSEVNGGKRLLHFNLKKKKTSEQEKKKETRGRAGTLDQKGFTEIRLGGGPEGG